MVPGRQRGVDSARRNLIVNENQQKFFCCTYGAFMATATVGILASKGGFSAEPEVFLHLLLILIVVAALMYLWVRRNPDLIDRLFR
jgi:hypothetical protein